MIKNMNSFLKSLPNGHDGIFDWDFLKGAFGPTIMPMDLDGIVERNGWFLVFETKQSEDIIISYGQQKTLKSLIKLGCFTVMTLYGKTEKTITSYVLSENYKGEIVENIVKPAKAEMVFDECNKWYKRVNNKLSPKYPDMYERMIAHLKDENSELRAALAERGNKISILADHISKLEFKLNAPKPNKSSKTNKSTSLYFPF